MSVSQGYSSRAWQTEDGLPRNSVTSIVQTRDGYLWIGTYGGVVRFDGTQFRVFDGGNTPNLQNSRVTSLFEDKEGTLWIGHETGDLSRYKSGRFESVRVGGPPREEQIIAIGNDTAGGLWAFNQSAAGQRLQDGLVALPVIRSNEPPGMLTITRNEAGAFWVARAGALFTLQSAHFQAFAPEGLPGSAFVQGIGAGRDGASFWLIAGGRVRKWKDNRPLEDWGPAPSGESSVTSMIELKNGSLAIGTLNQGLFLFSTNSPLLHFHRDDGLPHDWVRCLFEDREENLWVGTGGGGIAALRPARVAMATPPDLWQGRTVLCVASGRDGTVWAGTEGGGLYRLDQGGWSHFGENEGLANLFVWSAAQDAQGRVWAGTWGAGLFVKEGDLFVHPPGLEKATWPIPALLLDPSSNRLWAGTTAGLAEFSGGAPRLFGRTEGLERPDVRTIALGQDGTVWFGMFGGGLGSLKNGELRQFLKKDGLPSDFVQCLLPDADGSLWIGTGDGGLSRLKHGRFSSISTEQGLPNNVICHIADDGRGFLWMSSHRGILRLAKEELNRCADRQISTVHCLAYGQSDGLPSLECTGGLQPAGCQTPDGRLWFPTSKGLVIIDPAHVRLNPLPPPVLVETLHVDGEVLASGPELTRPCRIAPGKQRFEFHFAGMSFTAPEKVLFKYRLQGLERSWIDAGTNRVAFYSYLAPGEYVFHVTACNNDGLWNEAGATCAFTVLPFFWQTGWFLGSCTTAGLSAVGLAVLYGAHRRMRLHIKRVERQQTIERERLRIARDIHDDLGASLTRITLLSQTARSQLGDPKQAGANLDRIYGTARDLTRALEEIVWAVNPRHDSLDSLASYLGRFAQEYAAAGGLRCRLDLPVRLPSWPLTAETRHNLFLAFKEALHNALKHAKASEVRITLALKEQGFTLSVDDNGCGFVAPMNSPSEPAQQGNGLVNMRRRLAELGGSCQISSQAGRGTTVQFDVPVEARLGIEEGGS